MLDQKTLDEIWDADDAEQSEARVRVELDEGGPYDDIERAELKTQLARALGLQGRYDEAADILIEIEAEDAPVVVTRILLESGRIVHSAGDPVGASNLFQQSAEIAEANGLDGLLADAQVMLAVASGAEVQLAEASDEDNTEDDEA
ncbi:hypothetical protein [Lacisediminihabitans changchengi]|uniref:Tetratricopeptide repeat protein n=1 Tax=Lacisediminihabitans changchengi TaxID=2787634 RepID=A0A934SLE1_9MICO|nr:hypothetical protein [Lacisediminihabitans changchengi]MBK4347486.1 hypothetical protein [Lacisediminihabitans changchengi]